MVIEQNNHYEVIAPMTTPTMPKQSYTSKSIVKNNSQTSMSKEQIPSTEPFPTNDPTLPPLHPHSLHSTSFLLKELEEK